MAIVAEDNFGSDVYATKAVIKKLETDMKVSVCVCVCMRACMCVCDNVVYVHFELWISVCCFI